MNKKIIAAALLALCATGAKADGLDNYCWRVNEYYSAIRRQPDVGEFAVKLFLIERGMWKSFLPWSYNDDKMLQARYAEPCAALMNKMYRFTPPIPPSAVHSFYQSYLNELQLQEQREKNK